MKPFVARGGHPAPCETHWRFPETGPHAIPRANTIGEEAVATTFSEAISRAPLRAFSVVTFVICMLVLICDGMDAQLLGIVAPKVIEDFGTDRTTFGWAMSAALVGFGLGSWGGGWRGGPGGPWGWAAPAT